MKIKKNIYKKVCDMGGCLKTAQYCIVTEGVFGTDICGDCLRKLYKEIKRVLYDKKE